jgi:MYXO-CTERM domain-containing protein
MPFSKLPLVLAISSLLVACAGAEVGDDESLGQIESAVQGGELATNRAHNFAVGIASRYGGVCTGTLIAPNLVLTARHCVVPPDGSSAVTCADRFGKNVPVEALGVTTSPNLFRAQTVYHVSEIVTPKETGFCGNDIALLILEENIPSSEAKPATPVVQFSMTDHEKIGSEITAMGYGITNPSSKDSGHRRIRQNIGILCVPGSDRLACDRRYSQLIDSDAEFITEGWVCSGDSGGGAFEPQSFDEGSPYVLGALSRGPQTETRCLAAVYTRTDAHADMIVAAGLKAADQGGYEAPEWTKPASLDDDALEAEGDDCEDDVCSDTSATDPAPRRIITRTTGCAAAPGSAPGSAAALLGLIAAALVAVRRRRS